jgi:hypothetical protein
MTAIRSVAEAARTRIDRDGAPAGPVSFPRRRDVAPHWQTAYVSFLVVLLASATALGGWTFFSWRDAVLAVVAAGGFALVLAVPAGDRHHVRIERVALAIALLPGMYLLPLPPAVASMLSAHDVAASSGVAWRPLSIALDETWRAWLKLATVGVAFVVASRLHAGARARVLGCFIALALVESVWGIAQVAGGAGSALRPFGTDVVTAATGSFANRNHLAALIVAVSPWCCWAAIAGGSPDRADRARRRAASVAGVLAVSLGFAAVVASRSRAGIAIVVIGFVVMAAAALRREPRSNARAALAVITLVLGALLASVAATPLFDRLAADPWRRERIEILDHGVQAATAYLPLGAGPGTFAAAYPAFETRETLHPFFVNRAHNELIELTVEVGLFAPLLALLVLVLAGRAFIDGWRAAVGGGPDAWRLPAATALLGLGLHSMVDYPLRAPLVALLASTLLGMLVAAPPPHRH